MSDSDSEELELRSRQAQKRRDRRSSSGALASEGQAEAPKARATIMDSKVRRISSGVDAADEALCLSPRTHEVLGLRKRKGSGAPIDTEPRPRQTVKIPKLDLAPEEARECLPQAEMKSPARAQVLPSKGSSSSSSNDFISFVQTPKSTATAGSKTRSGSLTPSSARAAAVLSAAAACCAAASMLRGTGSRGEAQATSRSASLRASTTTTTTSSSSSSAAMAATPGKTPAKGRTSIDVMRKVEAAAAAAAAASPRVEPPTPKVQESEQQASNAAEDPTTQPRCAATPESTAPSSMTSMSIQPQHHHPSPAPAPTPACPGSRFASCRRGVFSPPCASRTATLPQRKSTAREKSPAKAREMAAPVGGDEGLTTRRGEAARRSSSSPAASLATPRGRSAYTPASRRPPPSTGRKGRRVFVSDSDSSSDGEGGGGNVGRVGGEPRKRVAVAAGGGPTKRGRAEVGRCTEGSPDNAALSTRRRLQASKATKSDPPPSSSDSQSLPATERCPSPTFGRDPPSSRPPLSTAQSADAPVGALERRVGAVEEALCEVLARLEEQTGMMAQVQEEKRAMSLELDECKRKLQRLESAQAAGVGFEVSKVGADAASKRRRTPLGMREANSLLL